VLQDHICGLGESPPLHRRLFFLFPILFILNCAFFLSLVQSYFIIIHIHRDQIINCIHNCILRYEIYPKTLSKFFLYILFFLISSMIYVILYNMYRLMRITSEHIYMCVCINFFLVIKIMDLSLLNKYPTPIIFG